MGISIKEVKDEVKVYEESHTYNTTFTIEQLNQQISMLENNITNDTVRKKELEAKKTAALAIK